eukprot:c28469_g1_i1 orf=694-4590(-)
MQYRSMETDLLSMEGEDPCNALIIYATKKRKKERSLHGRDSPSQKGAKLSKNKRKRLRRIQEEKERKEKRCQVLETLEKHKLADAAYNLLHASSTLGQVATMRGKLRRALQCKRAGLAVPSDIPLFHERTIDRDSTDFDRFIPTDSQGANGAGIHKVSVEGKRRREKKNLSGKEFVSRTTSAMQMHEGIQHDTVNDDGFLAEEVIANDASSNISGISHCAGGKIHRQPGLTTENHNPVMKEQNYDNSKLSCDVQMLREQKFVVHVSRPEQMEKARRNLPIVMMEQEIMELVNEHPVVIVCGETGCGKTTQVPQFLYEAGFASSACKRRSGMIGVTQPRRVAVLATAKRVSQELNLKLGQEVGFQVRHDCLIGENCCIKFMTDGILLREVQSDFLLRKYSVIVLDEAHERSLNTDILFGMLSRILALRQNLYEEQSKALQGGDVSNGDFATPLKLIVMSATLCADDFVSNRRLFAMPPPVVQVPTRQFPVTIHFSAKTELIDYVSKAYKKVCAIHRKLPPGGVLVFLTGQAEVNFLCQKLQKAFSNSRGATCFTQHANTTELERSGSEVDTKLFDPDLWCSIEKAVDGVGTQKYSGGSLGYVDEDTCDVETDDKLEILDTVGDSCMENDEDDTQEPDMNIAFDRCIGTGSIGLKRDMVTVPSVNGHHWVPSDDPGPLHVLPLYAALPAAAQLRVFNAVPERSRLVVVATNVAETSITIPGIKYVVDCGRAKEKDYDCLSGVAKYEVRWISKASAAQRAGRAGRTGPGYCYRLYSSAIFNDTFPEFAAPEIYRAPIEGLVLLMKSMGINKVMNFPFPSQPDQQSLAGAEHCLQALSALDSKSGLLTSMGRAMAAYPISPRHSRMLLCAMQAGCCIDDTEGASLLLAYATAVAAALSLESPFLRDIGIEGAETVGGSGGHNDNISSGTQSLDISVEAKKEQGKVVRRVGRAAAHSKFRCFSSDALSTAAALRAYEASDDREVFSNGSFLHSRIMHEMSKLRHQLLRLVFLYRNKLSCKNEENDAEHILHGTHLAAVETLWLNLDMELRPEQGAVLREAICAGWADHVARKVSLQETVRRKEGGKCHKAVRYQACAVEEPVFLHPSSVLAKFAPEFVVYTELIQTSKLYMRGVTLVEPKWLVSYATTFCTFSKPLAEPPPWYATSSDQVMCWVSPCFGPYLWQLPLQSFPMKGGKDRTAVFACALLQGKVLPSLALFRQHLSADPSIILKPEGHAHKRVCNLLYALGMESTPIDTCAKLKTMWDVQPQFLFQEILSWLQNKYREQLHKLWIQIKQEAQLCIK